jgi:hypothetical protein
MDDIQVYLDPTGRGLGHQINPRRLDDIPTFIHQELVKASTNIGKRLLRQLRMAYAVAIRERPRKEGETLRQRLNRALVMDVMQTPQEVAVGIFNLFTIDELTRHEGKGTEDEGWFFLYEDGHDGLAHGSRRFVFVDLDHAVTLAEDCARWAKLDAEKAAEFVSYVKKVFAGRHGEGIMTKIDAPLFYEFPDYGTPRDHGYERTHDGLEAWNILYTHGSLDDARKATRYSVEGRPVGEHWALQELEKAFDRAAARVRR